MSDAPRILFLDIETKPALIYSFGIRDQHITHKQIKQDGGTICVGLKWAGERKVRVFSEWEHGYDAMLQEVHSELCEAEAVATYNGASFDIPKLMGNFLKARMPPPPKLTQIDIYRAVRKMGFICNKLDYIAPLLGLGQKVKHEGLQMWIDVMDGCPKARRKMATYCAGDVRLLEDVYNRVLPYLVDHPHMGRGECPSCGSGHAQLRGYHKTASFWTERLQCQKCAKWRLGKRKKASAMIGVADGGPQRSAR
jgi:uncharacterized protein YprB with RNaseH-like and TPR domain